MHPKKFDIAWPTQKEATPEIRGSRRGDIYEAGLRINLIWRVSQKNGALKEAGGMWRVQRVLGGINARFFRDEYEKLPDVLLDLLKGLRGPDQGSRHWC